MTSGTDAHPLDPNDVSLKKKTEKVIPFWAEQL